MIRTVSGLTLLVVWALVFNFLLAINFLLQNVAYAIFFWLLALGVPGITLTYFGIRRPARRKYGEAVNRNTCPLLKTLAIYSIILCVISVIFSFWSSGDGRGFFVATIPTIVLGYLTLKIKSVPSGEAIFSNDKVRIDFGWHLLNIKHRSLASYLAWYTLMGFTVFMVILTSIISSKLLVIACLLPLLPMVVFGLYTLKELGWGKWPTSSPTKAP